MSVITPRRREETKPNNSSRAFCPRSKFGCFLLGKKRTIEAAIFFIEGLFPIWNVLSQSNRNSEWPHPKKKRRENKIKSMIEVSTRNIGLRHGQDKGYCHFPRLHHRPNGSYMYVQKVKSESLESTLKYDSNCFWEIGNGHALSGGWLDKRSDMTATVPPLIIVVHCRLNEL